MGDPEEQSPSGALYTPSEIERLGRERPEVFSSVWQELGFCFALLGSAFLSEYFTSGFHVLLPPLTVELDIPSKAAVWPASVYSLVTGAFLLPFGRLADMYGGYLVFNAGLIWMFVWTLIAGFSQNYIMVIFCRALQGLGPAAFMPSGIMLLGSIYRPGPRKNFVFSLYGALAPVGFYGGIFFAGVAAQFLYWAWFFFFGVIILALVFAAGFSSIPSDKNSKQSDGIKMDWLGAATVVPALILIVYGLTDGAHAPNGWATPYILVTFILGWILLGAFIYVEGWVAEQPLLPGDIFNVKGLKPMAVALFFQYGVFGMYLYFSSFYIQNVMGASAILTSAWYTPMAVGGIILALIGGVVLHLLSGTLLLILSGICYIFCALLFAIMPEGASYWEYVFPAMLCSTLGIDVTYNVTNIFITTSMPKARQGLAGALINSLLFLGISFFLGLADLAVAETADRGQRESYQVAFFFATACAAVGAIIMTAFVRVGKAEAGLTADEKAELERELTRRSSI